LNAVAEVELIAVCAPPAQLHGTSSSDTSVSAVAVGYADPPVSDAPQLPELNVNVVPVSAVIVNAPLQLLLLEFAIVMLCPVV
jgi:hypothetical protein